MIIISDLSYVEVISASSIVGGANEVSGTSTTTTSTNKSFVTKKAGFYVKLPAPKPTPVGNNVNLAAALSIDEKALLAL